MNRFDIYCNKKNQKLNCRVYHSFIGSFKGGYKEFIQAIFLIATYYCAEAQDKSGIQASDKKYIKEVRNPESE